MTNAEKYKEVFGFEPEREICPTAYCKNCPVDGQDCGKDYKWWDEEYKEPKKDLRGE